MDMMKRIHKDTQAIRKHLGGLPKETAEEVCDRLRGPQEGQPGRRSVNHHFVNYFNEARKRCKKEEKTDQEIFVDYRKEHPEQNICKNKPSHQHYLDACRKALENARNKKAPKKM